MLLDWGPHVRRNDDAAGANTFRCIDAAPLTVVTLAMDDASSHHARVWWKTVAFAGHDIFAAQLSRLTKAQTTPRRNQHIGLQIHLNCVRDPRQLIDGRHSRVVHVVVGRHGAIGIAAFANLEIAAVFEAMYSSLDSAGAVPGSVR